MGGEWNTSQSSEKTYRFAFAFPDAYEIAQSGLGIKILYELINSHSQFSCERVFAPMPDMESFLREKKEHLFSLETHTLIKDFDIVGFTLQYEMTYTNILNMLDLSGIPLYSKDRDETHPFIIAGGPCSFNPEPVADFFDMIVIGDGEEAVVEILDKYTQWKQSGSSKMNFLELCSEIEGVYIPSFYEPVFNQDGTIDCIKPTGTNVRFPVKRRVLENINRFNLPLKPAIPYVETVHDRIMLEICRGCTRSCRFCRAGYIYRPLRERNTDNILDIIGQGIKNTGYDEVSLVSLSCSDYSQIEHLLLLLAKEYEGEGVRVSLPSLRIDNFSLKLADLVKTARKSSLTFAPEAGSQRLRDVINKNVTEEQILSTLKEAEKMGWQQIKLYFMIGLPTETDEDVTAIADLANRAAKETRLRLTVSVSHFVPQPFTPFQWEPMEKQEKLREKVYLIKNRLNYKKVKFNWHEPLTSFMEGVFTRGDRKLSKVIEHAFLSGARFDGWSDYFTYSHWQKAFSETEIDPEFYIRKREIGETLPWSHIDAGISSDYLLEEKNRAESAVTINDCRDGSCTGCGLCEGTIEHKFASIKEHSREKKASSSNINNRHSIARIRLRRDGSLRWISHLDVQRTIEKSLKRAHIPVSYSEGFHPRPRISIALPLPLGHASECEWLEIILYEEMTAENLTQLLQPQLPEGLTILDSKIVGIQTKPITAGSVKMVNNVTISKIGQPEKDKLEKELEDFLSLGEIIITRKSQQKDIKPLIGDVTLEITETGANVRIETFMHPTGGGVKPDEVITAAFGGDIASKSDYRRMEIFILIGDNWQLP
ncbi:MAG: TIGR03960 family B12-binding radical SAM protein [Firmicutes bacterium]|nr:TIGR03960 family B12-binding radical SAM protein [Bacillota bacterium]